MHRIFQPVWRKLFRAVLFLLLYGWLFKAIYVFLDPSYFPGVGLTARVFLALREGLATLPETLFFVASAATWAGGLIHANLEDQLGYDPFAAPALGGAPGFDGPSSVYIDLALYGAISGTVLLSAGQFLLLVTVGAFGTRVAWRPLGRPVILGDGARIAYTILTAAVAAAIVWWTFDASVVSGVPALLCVVVLYQWPVIAGLPLAVLDGLGLRVDALSKVFAGLFERRASRPRPNSDGPSGPSNGRASAGTDGSPNEGPSQSGHKADKEHRSRNTRSEPPPTPADPKTLIDDALETFGLDAASVTHPVLVKRYRTLAMKNHPDVQGSERLMAMINRDYELLLAHYGWQR